MKKFLLITGEIAKVKKAVFGVQSCSKEDYLGMGEILIEVEKIEDAPEKNDFDRPAVIVEGVIAEDRYSQPMSKALREIHRFTIPKENIIMIIEK